jgi:hypothetical protein
MVSEQQMVLYIYIPYIKERIWASIDVCTYGTVMAKIGCAVKKVMSKCTKIRKGKIWYDGENKITVCLIMKNNIPYFLAYSVHLTYNAHPKLFCIPFEVQITCT